MLQGQILLRLLNRGRVLCFGHYMVVNVMEKMGGVIQLLKKKTRFINKIHVSYLFLSLCLPSSINESLKPQNILLTSLLKFLEEIGPTYIFLWKRGPLIFNIM